MSATRFEHDPQLLAAEAARSSANALGSAEPQLQAACVLESSLQQEVSRVQSDKTQIEERCELRAWRVCLTRDSSDSASEINRSFLESVWEFRVQHDQEFADLCFRTTIYCTGWPLITVAVKRNATFYVLA